MHGWRVVEVVPMTSTLALNASPQAALTFGN